jgi:PAS domain S-box-containing protein
LDPLDLLNLLPAYVTVLDRAYRIVQSNEAFRRDFGEAAGKPCYNAYKGRETVCPDCPASRTLADGRPASWEESIQTVHGETVYAVAHVVPVVDARGRIVGVVKLSCDVTAFKRHQRQLELSQQEYKALFHGVPCYISIQDRDFNVIRANRFFEKDFGRALGRKCYEVYKGREAKCDVCPVEKTFEDGEIHCSEEAVRTADGEVADMIVYTAPIRDLSGQTFAVMEMSTNIAEVKRLQRELATLGQAVAVTAHAIKNILNGLEGGAYVVQSGLRRGDPDLARRGWEMVKEGVELVGQFVKDILLIAKGRSPEYEQALPADLARKVWTLFEKKARDLGIDLILDLEDGEDTPVHLDPRGIHTVLSNLVANAMDACLAQGDKDDLRIRIRVRRPGGDGVMFEVEDNGPGIPPSVRERLFQEVVSTKGSRGTGLGLVVTRKIVEEHGGTVALAPSTDGLTRFRVRLPRAPLQEAPLGTDPARRPAQGGMGGL